MTNIELLRIAKPGDRFRKGNGDVLEIVEMPPFDEKGLPGPPFGKMLLNGESVTWAFSKTVRWNDSTDNPISGLTPIPAEPVVDLTPARGWKTLLAILECGSHYYHVACASNGGFIGELHKGGLVILLYAGPSYAEAVAACEADMDGVQ